MAKVHLFPLVVSLYSDTRLPLQYPGGGNSPAARQVELSTLLAWLEDNLQLPQKTQASVSASTYTYTLPAGKWLLGIAVSSASGQSFNLGLSAGTDELIQGGIVSPGGVSTFGANLYAGGSSLSLYFSALTGSTTLTFLTL